MLRSLTVLVIVLLLSPAEARKRHHHVRNHIDSVSDNTDPILPSRVLAVKLGSIPDRRPRGSVRGLPEETPVLYPRATGTAVLTWAGVAPYRPSDRFLRDAYDNPLTLMER